MVKFISFLTIFLIICEFNYSTSFIWVSMKYGDIIPSGAILFESYHKIYVGRALYLNTWQVTEIHTHRQRISEAIVMIYDTKIENLDQFEVLVAKENCKWVSFDKKHVPENIVRGGTSWNLEPVFVGRNNNNLISIFLTSNKIQTNEILPTSNYKVLVCDTYHKWVRATSISVPEKIVSTGESGSYVARLLGPALYIPGMVLPKSNKTFVWYKGNKLESFNIQVLFDMSQKYIWKPMTMETGIPDYAVVCGVSDNNELTYISKKYNELTGTRILPISFSEINNEPHDILVENVDSLY